MNYIIFKNTKFVIYITRMKTTLLFFTLFFISMAILDRSYYDSLCTWYFYVELPVSASPDDIREAFRKLSKKYHPDRNPGSR